MNDTYKYQVSNTRGDGQSHNIDADSSWRIKVTVRDVTQTNHNGETIQENHTLRTRVRGNRDHVGGLIQKVVEDLENNENVKKENWSEYEMWWPIQRRWLLKHHWMLDKYSIQADTELEFTKRNKRLYIELPNHQSIEVMANFSMDVLSVVRDICYHCEIRYHTELSLKVLPKGSYQTLNNSQSPIELKNTQETYGTMRAPARHGSKNEKLSSGTQLMETSNSEYKKFSAPGQNIDTEKEAVNKNLSQKADDTGKFLDSLKSLMEQDVKENDLVKLQFKYFTFSALSEKSDVFRIHQMYEQLKYSVLTDEFPVTEDQALTLGAIQYFIDECHRMGCVDPRAKTRQTSLENDQVSTSKDISAMLRALEEDLEGTTLQESQTEYAETPKLSETVKTAFPTKLLQKSFKQKFWLNYEGTTLTGFKTREDDSLKKKEAFKVEIRQAELNSDVSIKDLKYIVKIKPHNSDEIWLKFDSEHRYCKWFAALKLGCKGQTMASPNYNLEIDSLQQVIKIQDPNGPLNPVSESQIQNFIPKHYIPQRLLKKLGGDSIAGHILQQQNKISTTVKNCPTTAKRYYIVLWQHIEEAGWAYFNVAFKKESKKSTYLALSSEKIMKLDDSGNVIMSWWMQNLKEWKINWYADPKHVTLVFDRELGKDSQEENSISFYIPCPKNAVGEAVERTQRRKLQVVHEYIGGYMFHYMNKTSESDRAESEQTLRSILEVSNPWHT